MQQGTQKNIGKVNSKTKHQMHWVFPTCLSTMLPARILQKPQIGALASTMTVVVAGAGGAWLMTVVGALIL